MFDDQASADDGDDDDDFVKLTYWLVTVMILPLLRMQKTVTKLRIWTLS